MMARSRMELAWLLLMLLGGSTLAYRWDDPCNVQPAGEDLSDAGGEVTVPADCTNGSVWWNYPRGTLQVNFRSEQGRAFVVCLTATLGPELGAIAQLVHCHQLSVTSPPEGETVCLPEAGMQVTAMLTEPSFRTYMTLYDYTLKYE